VLPAEVKAAAEVVEDWAKVQGVAMRAARMFGPAVMLYELVAAVLDYFLVATGARKRGE